MSSRAASLHAAALVIALAASSGGHRPLAQGAWSEHGPQSPDQALATFELEPGYRIELVAAEPLIQSPVAMAFDERGRLYVVESRGYPGPLEGSHADAAAQGRIALLEDTNNDGRFDTRTEFATNLRFPNGVLPWNGGVFVTDAPDLLFLEDTTRDGVADERRIVLTGFSTSRTPQIRFSHPTLGIDNWVYLTSGLNGGVVTVPDRPDRPPVKFASSDSRFHPATLDFELTGGQSQFGLTFDDYGRRFTCSNRHPVWHVVLEPRYLARNPHLAFSDTVQEVSAVGSQATVWPISADMTTASFVPGLLSAPHAGTFTAASGVHIHRGDALPGDAAGSVFVCESAQNLVQRQILSPSGPTFVSRPARQGREFLASRDNWFRPVLAANGPDGALYIVDMYRKTIDHPQYVPEASRPQLDFESGRERGRIYRVVGQSWKRDTTRVDAGELDVRELVRRLEHTNAWWRETAQRLLVQKRDPGSIPVLRTAAREGRTPVSRVHALWTLEGIGALEDADIGTALRDVDAGVRENAVRLAEARVRASADLLTGLLPLANDPDARVRFQAALALGEANDPRTVAALAAIARRDGAERWTRAAILSSVGTRSSEFLRAFVTAPSPDAVRAGVMQDLGYIFGAGEHPERCLDLIREVVAGDGWSGWQAAALAGVADGLQTRSAERGDRSALLTLLSSGPGAIAVRSRLDQFFESTAARALDERLPADVRLAAIRLLGHTNHSIAGAPLERLLGPQHAPEIQIAAVRALTALPDQIAAARLLDRRRWQSLSPEVRDAVLSVLMSKEEPTGLLLDALESGSVAVTSVSPARRTRLTNHRNPAIQQRARAVFAPIDSGDRMRVYERLRDAVAARSGDATKGSRVFASYCGSCHSFRGTGATLAPDLSGIRNQPADAILLHTLVPDYEITPGYQAYVVETHDGQTIVGRLESEAPNSVTLKDATSRSHVILRSRVASMTASPSSLMPGELDRALSEQDLADLIRYLKADPGPADIPVKR